MLCYMSLSKVRPFPSGYESIFSAVKEQDKTIQKSTTYFEEAELEESPEWQLACRVAASKIFSRSELLPKFLLYVCAQRLAGNAHEITEQRIGTEVFQRPHGYNPGEDTIVRNYARLLRKRLTEYFDTEGIHHALRIEIPRGGYVPFFKPTSHKVEVPALTGSVPALVSKVIDPEPAHAGKMPLWAAMPARHLYLAASLLLVGLLGVVIGAWLRPMMGFMEAEHANSPAHALWIQLFQKNRNLMIVPPDSGLGILENLTGQPVTLEDYAGGRYFNADLSASGMNSENHDDLRKQRYTSMVGLKIATSLLQLPEFIANRSQVRDAREMSTEDFKNSDVILIGSVHSDPWVELFEKNFNFKLTYTGKVNQSYIENKNPAASERQIYRNGEDANGKRTYGVIDYLPNLQNTGHVLIIQGLNMAATQAAAETLFNRETIRPLLEKAKRADGSLNRFELLIETTSIVATAPNAHVIAMRIYPS